MVTREGGSEEPLARHLIFVFSATMLVSLAGAACLGALDVALHMGAKRALDMFEAVVLWVAIGGLLAVPMSVLVAIVAWPFRHAISRAQLVAALIGIVLQTVALLSFSSVIGLVFLPLAWLIAAGLSRKQLLGRIDHLATLFLALLLGLLALVAGLTLFRLPRFDWLLVGMAAVPGRIALVPMVILGTWLLLGALWLAERSATRHPRRTLRLLALIFIGVLLPLVSQRLFSGVGQQVLAGGRRTGPPNVVVIVLDTTRADYIGAYGHSGNLSPNLDRLAAEGTLYEDAISAADWTVPSHASLFTGLYPGTHGASFAHHRWLDDEFVTLAEMLKGEGYQTVGLVANRHIQESNLQQGLDHYVFLDDSEPSMLRKLTLAIGFPERWADKGSTQALEELQRWLHRTYDPSRPFFLFINLMEPHWRYFPPWRQRAAHLPPGVTYWEGTRLSGDFYGVHWLAGQQGNGPVEKMIRSLYGAEVAYQDEKLGQLLTLLRTSIDLDHTLLIITADHGENLGEANRWDHVFAVNDYLLHVPLVIRYPDRFPAGRRISGQVQLVDVVPTVYDVLRHAPPVDGLPGRSLVPERFVPRDFTFAESVPYYGHLERMSLITGMQRDISEFTNILQAIRTERYKYVRSSNGSEMLYDLRRDPDEAVNILAEHPAVAKELRQRLFEWQQGQPRYRRPEKDKINNPPQPLSREQREHLRSLGYVR